MFLQVAGPYLTRICNLILQAVNRLALKNKVSCSGLPVRSESGSPPGCVAVNLIRGQGGVIGLINAKRDKSETPWKRGLGISGLIVERLVGYAVRW